MGRRAAERRGNTNGVVFWPAAVLVLLVDLVTKLVAGYVLQPPGVSHPLVGDALRLTLSYNPGAAFGLHVGAYSRVAFLALTVVVLRGLWALYVRAEDRDNARVLALALLAGGAVGNAVDRVRSPLGVVDFLDVGVGAARLPVFNVADVAIAAGAAILGALLWRAHSAAAPAAAEAS